jgi:hypothetical protein
VDKTAVFSVDVTTPSREETVVSALGVVLGEEGIVFGTVAGCVSLG